jgi:hypothetical protein
MSVDFQYKMSDTKGLKSVNFVNLSYNDVMMNSSKILIFVPGCSWD